MNTSQRQLDNLPESDLELLSAYLDNQLSVAERLGLERRLGAEPRLRAELEELRATAALLRELEPVRPPRSFTLDPATAPRRAPAFPLAWFMQFGSGLAGLALVLLASMQLFVGGAAGAPFPAPEPEMAARSAFEPTMAPAAAQAAAPTSAPVGILEAPAPAEPAPGAGYVAGEVAKEPATEAVSTASDTGASGGAVDLPMALESAEAPSDEAAPPPMANSDAAAPDTQQLPPAVDTDEAEQRGVPPGLTLGVGVALLAFAAVSYLYSRRRA